jgi:hypothetical protein
MDPHVFNDGGWDLVGREMAGVYQAFNLRFPQRNPFVKWIRG